MRLTRKFTPTASRRSKEAVRIMPDGREICSQTPAGRAEYKRRRELRWNIDKGICCLCGCPVSLECATTEHPGGRGMGGSRRDDSVGSIRVACLRGNAVKASVSLERYLELPLEKRISNCRGWA